MKRLIVIVILMGVSLLQSCTPMYRVKIANYDNDVKYYLPQKRNNIIDEWQPVGHGQGMFNLNIALNMIREDKLKQKTKIEYIKIK